MGNCFHACWEDPDRVIPTTSTWSCFRSGPYPEKDRTDLSANPHGNIEKFVKALTTGIGTRGGTWIVVRCPRPSRQCTPVYGGNIRATGRNYRFPIGHLNSTLYLETLDLGSDYGIDSCFDPLTDHHAHIPYTDPYYSALGTLIFRAIRSRWARCINSLLPIVMAPFGMEIVGRLDRTNSRFGPKTDGFIPACKKKNPTGCCWPYAVRITLKMCMPPLKNGKSWDWSRGFHDLSNQLGYQGTKHRGYSR